MRTVRAARDEMFVLPQPLLLLLANTPALDVSPTLPPRWSHELLLYDRCALSLPHEAFQAEITSSKFSGLLQPVLFAIILRIMAANLLWMDLEMTGLDPVQDKILEVATIATDFNFTPMARYQAAVKADPVFMKQRMVGEFWDKNDATRQALITVSGSDQAKPTEQVETELVNFVKQYFDLTQPIYLAGNSIHQDRKFIELVWPELNALLNYRMLDVSAWKIIFENRGRKFTSPDMHRAMSDIEGSINELKYYLEKVTL